MTVTRYKAQGQAPAVASSSQILFTVPAGKIWKIRFNDRFNVSDENLSTNAYVSKLANDDILCSEVGYSNSSGDDVTKLAGTYVGVSSSSYAMTLFFGKNYLTTRDSSYFNTSSSDTLCKLLKDVNKNYIFINKHKDNSNEKTLTPTQAIEDITWSSSYTKVHEDDMILFEGEQIGCFGTDTILSRCYYGYDFTVYEEDL